MMVPDDSFAAATWPKYITLPHSRYGFHMQPAEAPWIGQVLARLSTDRLSPLLNVGSGSAHFRRSEHPWIESAIFKPLLQRGVDVVHLDIKDAPGVDLVGDPCDPQTCQILQQRNFRCVLCANVLEHVVEPQRLASNLFNLLPAGGLMLVSVPRAYPYHACPIDTGFRPTPADLAALFPGARTLASEVVDCGSFIDEIRRQPLLIPRLLLPFYRPMRWFGLMHRLPWLWRRYQTTCVLLEKL